MSKMNDVKNALQTAPQTTPARVPTSIEAVLKMPNIKQKFEEMLGKKANAFMSSIISAVHANNSLKMCDPMSVVSSAAVAASLDLPINPSLGFAHIVPYKSDGISKAQFQMGWKGFVQLAMRSGQYERMNCSEVYEDELDFYNPITGDFKLKEISDWKQRAGSQRDKIVGYVAYFRLLNGFFMYLYMTKGQVEAHGREFSKSFSSEYGNWKKRFDSMAKKTVIKLLLSKFGIMSIEMQKAVQVDQAIVKADGELEYVDNANAIDTESLSDAPLELEKVNADGTVTDAEGTTF